MCCAPLFRNPLAHPQLLARLSYVQRRRSRRMRSDEIENVRNRLRVLQHVDELIGGNPKLIAELMIAPEHG
jgi:hypothetical protein